MARAAGKLDERCRSGGKQITVLPARCGTDQTVEIMRKGKLWA
jgi:hypothetical protein